MVAVVHSASGEASSYFRLWLRPGQSTRAGTIEVRNLRNHRITVMLDPVGSLTASTLGSAYELRGSGHRATAVGSAGWLKLAHRRVTLPAHGAARVRVSVRVPKTAGPGDYLSGISVQARTLPQQERRGNLTIASVQRYAVGMMVRLPGARHPGIVLTRAKVRREPSGITFYVAGRNTGNVILQNVSGNILITRGRRVVSRIAIAPGTFVTSTAIAYPVLARRERPREGDMYRVRATMRYRGGVARLDQRVRFGHGDAVRQQQFGGPAARGHRTDTSWTLPALAAALALFLCGLLALRRRQLRGRRATPRIVARARAGARKRNEPLTALRISSPDSGEPRRRVVRLVRDRLRRSDTLLRVRGSHLLVLRTGDDLGVARVLATELERYLARRAPATAVLVEVIPVGPDTSAGDLLHRPSPAADPDRADSLALDSVAVHVMLEQPDTERS